MSYTLSISLSRYRSVSRQPCLKLLYYNFLGITYFSFSCHASGCSSPVTVAVAGPSFENPVFPATSYEISLFAFAIRLVKIKCGITKANAQNNLHVEPARCVGWVTEARDSVFIRLWAKVERHPDRANSQRYWICVGWPHYCIPCMISDIAKSIISIACYR